MKNSEISFIKKFKYYVIRNIYKSSKILKKFVLIEIFKKKKKMFFILLLLFLKSIILINYMLKFFNY